MPCSPRARSRSLAKPLPAPASRMPLPAFPFPDLRRGSSSGRLLTRHSAADVDPSPPLAYARFSVRALPVPLRLIPSPPLPLVRVAGGVLEELVHGWRCRTRGCRSGVGEDVRLPDHVAVAGHAGCHRRRCPCPGRRRRPVERVGVAGTWIPSPPFDIESASIDCVAVAGTGSRRPSCPPPRRCASCCRYRRATCPWRYSLSPRYACSCRRRHLPAGDLAPRSCRSITKMFCGLPALPAMCPAGRPSCWSGSRSVTLHAIRANGRS